MKDNRLYTLAGIMLDHSVNAKKGDRLQIDAYYASKPLVLALIKEASARGIMTWYNIIDEELQRVWTESLNPDDSGFSEESIKMMNEWDMRKWQDLDQYICIRGSENAMEMSGIDQRKQKIYTQGHREVHDVIIDERKWVLFEYPTRALAQSADMAYEDFFDFVMNVSIVDYNKMYSGQLILADLMAQTDKVQIFGPGIDLEFSIKGYKPVPCYGLRNIPDGEVYTAPVRDSVNGVITYNVTSTLWGKSFSNIEFEFRDGCIVKAKCDGNTDELIKILDTDEGARYIGEFSLGVNNRIKKPIGNTLFDEKIGGSFHLTPGNAYKKCFNGNKSSIHWDLICIQNPEYGGGEIKFDGLTIRRDGKFISDELASLNPGSR